MCVGVVKTSDSYFLLHFSHKVPMRLRCNRRPRCSGRCKVLIKCKVELFWEGDFSVGPDLLFASPSSVQQDLGSAGKETQVPGLALARQFLKTPNVWNFIDL